MLDRLRSIVDIDRLSDAERRVFALAVTGRPLRAIATQLCLTEATVHSHLTRIYAKLDVGSRVELLGVVSLGLLTGAAAESPPRSGRAPTASTPASKRADREAIATFGSLLSVALLVRLQLPTISIVAGTALLACALLVAWRAAAGGWFLAGRLAVAGALVSVDALVQLGLAGLP